MRAYRLIPVPALSRIVRSIADDELHGNAYVCVLAEVDLTQVESVRAAYAQAVWFQYSAHSNRRYQQELQSSGSLGFGPEFGLPNR